MTMWNFIEIYWLEALQKLSLKIYFFAIFLVPSWFLRSMGAVPQNWLIPPKFHKNQNCRVSKSKIIMCLWSVALKARKAAKWPRTFYMVWTVLLLRSFEMKCCEHLYHLIKTLFLLVTLVFMILFKELRQLRFTCFSLIFVKQKSSKWFYFDLNLIEKNHYFKKEGKLKYNHLVFPTQTIEFQNIFWSILRNQ